MLHTIALACALATSAAGVTVDADATPVAAAAAALEAQDIVAIGAVGIDGHRGDTSVAIDELVAAGASIDDVVALSSSQSPVARVAAAQLLAGSDEPRAHTALITLLRDDTRVRVRRGCLTDSATVADVVTHVIRHARRR
jgi:hypothetical protein